MESTEKRVYWDRKGVESVRIMGVGYIQVPPFQMLPCDWLVEITSPVGVLRSTTAAPGVPSVTITGRTPTRRWCVESWDSQLPWRASGTRGLDLELEISGWIMSGVLGTSPISQIVAPIPGECITAVTMKMWVCTVLVVSERREGGKSVFMWREGGREGPVQRSELLSLLFPSFSPSLFSPSLPSPSLLSLSPLSLSPSLPSPSLLPSLSSLPILPLLPSLPSIPSLLPSPPPQLTTLRYIFLFASTTVPTPPTTRRPFTTVTWRCSITTLGALSVMTPGG